MKTMKMIGNERGFVLVLALVTMAVMTIIGISIMMNMNIDMHLSSNERESKVAFQLAEAGINEAIARLHLSSSNAMYVGEQITDANYRTTAWNVGNSLGNDFGFSVGGNRNSADNLNYDVTITYLNEANLESFCDENDNVANNSGTHPNVPPLACENTNAEVVMFGQDFNIAATMTPIKYGKHPVYRILSTGTSGNNTTRTIEVDLGASSLNTDTNAGLNTNTCLDVSGGAAVLESVIQDPTCPDTCADIIAAGITASCTEAAPDEDMTTFLGDDIADIIDFADEKHYCLGATCSAAGPPPDDIPSSGAIDTVVSDWGDFAGDTYSTMIYINNAGGKDVSISGDYTGRGIFIVTGDLTLSGNFQYEGLVYVFGTLTVSGGGGSMNVTGGVMANQTIQVNGGINVDYDQETLLDVSRQSSASAMLIWKRF